MGHLEGRVAIITGAARGLGREHALLFAAEGASVVVNDLGSGADGQGDDRGAAQAVVDEIEEAGGKAIANTDDVADWEGGRRLISAALGAFDKLHILVNNAGVLRDRMMVNMTEEDFDSVISVHLKGHFVPTRHAASYWREQSRAGRPLAASVINTSSTSGLEGNPGQVNYGAAKAGIAAMTIIAAQELSRYGVRVNAVVPAARTRLTAATPGLSEIVAAPDEDSRFDAWDPANVSPLVAWLASTSCTATGRVLLAFGGDIQPMTGWAREPGISRPDRWSIEAIAGQLPPMLG